jgi:hypothetical protein
MCRPDQSAVILDFDTRSYAINKPSGYWTLATVEIHRAGWDNSRTKARRTDSNRAYETMLVRNRALLGSLDSRG